MRTNGDVRDEPAAPDVPGLFAIAGGLARAGADLAHNTAQLAACESRVIVRRLAVRAGLFFAFLVLATTGLLLMLVGAAVALDTWLRPWLAFVLVGVVTTVAGALAARRAVRKLGDRDMAFPKTLAELEADLATFRERRRAGGDPR